MQQEEYYIFSFKSRSDAMGFSSALSRAGLNSAVISTPSGIVNGCSLSVRVIGRNFQGAAAVLRSGRYQSFLGAFSVSFGNFSPKTARII